MLFTKAVRDSGVAAPPGDLIALPDRVWSALEANVTSSEPWKQWAALRCLRLISNDGLTLAQSVWKQAVAKHADPVLSGEAWATTAALGLRSKQPCHDPSEILHIIESLTASPPVLAASVAHLSLLRKQKGRALKGIDAFLHSRTLMRGLEHPSRLVRFGVLAILSQFKQPAKSKLVAFMLTAETAAFRLDGSRESTAAIASAAALVSSGLVSDSLIIALGHWLAGVLHVRLAPVWRSVGEAAFTLSGHLSGNLSAELFGPLIDALEQGQQPMDVVQPAQPKKQRLAVGAPVDAVIHTLSEQYNAAQDIVSGECNPTVYVNQLLTVLARIPMFAQQQNRRLVPLFASFAIDSYCTAMSGAAVDVFSNHQAVVDAAACSTPQPARTRRESTQCMIAWLRLLSLFHNPKSLYCNDTLHDMYFDLLKRGDGETQRLALSCLATFKASWFMPYLENLDRLIDESTFRTELTTFAISRTEGSIRAEHRDSLLPVLISLLIPKMTGRMSRTKSKGALGARRAAVLSFLAGLDPSELDPLFTYFLSPFDRALPGILEIKPPPLLASSQLKRAASALNVSVLSGYVSFASTAHHQLGTRATSQLPVLTAAMSIVLQLAVLRTDEAFDGSDDDEQAQQLGVAKSGRAQRNACLRQFASWIDMADGWSGWNDLMPTVFMGARKAFEGLPVEGTQQRTGALDLLCTLSRHPSLVPCLSFTFPEGSGLIPLALACLSAPRSTPPVVGAALDLLENLAQAHAESDDETVCRVLPPHLPLVLAKLGTLVRNGAGIDDTPCPVLSPQQQRSVLDVLVRMCKHQLSEDQAVDLTTTLMSLVGMTATTRTGWSLNEPGRILAMDALSATLTSLPKTHSLSEHVPSLSVLWGSISSFGLRRAAEGLWHSLSLHLPELEHASQLLCKMSADDTRAAMGDPDFDVRLAAYSELDATLHSIPPLALRAILFHHSQALTHDDVSIRAHASVGIVRIVEWASSLVDVVLNSARSGLRKRNPVVQSEWATVLRKVAPIVPESCPGVAALVTDDDSDFFLSIMHVQPHRHIKALRRLAAAAKEGRVDPPDLSAYYMPLVIQALDSDQAGISNEAALTLTDIASVLPWPAYRELMMKGLRRLGVGSRADSTAAKAGQPQAVEEPSAGALRSVCSLLDGFHGTNDASQRFIIERVLPGLRLHLLRSSAGQGGVRASVALAIVRVLRLLPTEMMREQLVALYHVLCPLLRSHEQEGRDAGRKALLGVVKVAGPLYIGCVVSALKDALSGIGHQRHVLGFTVCQVVKEAAPMATADELDSPMGMILDVLGEDLFGRVAAEKTVDKVARRMKETGKSGAPGALELLAQHSSFPSGATRIVDALDSAIFFGEAGKGIAAGERLANCLRRVASGAAVNPSATPESLTAFVKSMLRKSLDDFQLASERPQVEPAMKRARHDVAPRPQEGPHALLLQPLGDKFKRYDPKKETARKQRPKRDHSQRFVAFALGILLSAIKQGRLETEGTNWKDLVDPIVPLVVQCLTFPDDEIVQSAVKASTTLVRLSLPCMSEQGPVMARCAMNLARGGGYTGSPIVQAAFRLLAALMRQCQAAASTLTDEDLSVILTAVRQDVDEPEQTTTTFSLLRAVLGQKFVSPEVYDLMERVSEQLVRGQTGAVRELCGQALIQFLQNYPLTPRRLRQHFDFLIRNLGYSEEPGRQSVLETLGSLIEHMPQATINTHCELMFLPLSTRIVNDQAPSCRAMAATVVGRLIARVGAEQRSSLLGLVLHWYTDDERPLLRRAGAQLAGIFASVDAQSSGDRLMDSMLSSLARESDWTEVYHTCNAMMTLLSKVPSLGQQLNWGLVEPLLVHEHAWVRFASGRLLGAGLAQTDDSWKLWERLSEPGALFALTRLLARQLDSRSLSERLGEQASRNLLAVCRVLIEKPHLTPKSFWPSRQGEDKDEDEEEEEGELDPMGWVLRRVARSARRGGEVTLRKTVALQWLAAAATTLGGHVVAPQLDHVLAAVFRLSEDAVDEPVRMLAGEVAEVLREQCGAVVFASTWARVRKSVEDVRKMRRQRRAIDAVMDPEVDAQRRRRHAEGNKRRKKAKRG